MYSTRPPRPGDATQPGGAWGLRRAVRLPFADPAELTHDSGHTALLGTYLTDMLRPYRLGLRPGALDQMTGQSYGEMAEAVIARAVLPGEDVDLLVLAYAIPDITPGRATATYLSHICPGNPLAFAICDQGRAAAFTGLRLIREYATSGCRRGLLVVVEQAELPYDPGVPVEVPLAHSAVALLFDTDAVTPAGMVGIHPGTPVAGTAPILAAEFAPLTAGVTTILGSTILGSTIEASAAGLAAGRVRLADAGRPYTGVWWELAGLLAGEVWGGEADAGTPDRWVLVADYDPHLRYLCHVTFDRQSSQ